MAKKTTTENEPHSTTRGEISKHVSVVNENTIPFDIDNIPTEELRRQYIDYSIQLPITIYTNAPESANIESIEPISPQHDDKTVFCSNWVNGHVKSYIKT